MFEVLKYLTDLISKALPAISQKRTAADRRALAVALFTLYADINNVVARGRMMVESINRFIVDFERRAGDPPFGLHERVLADQSNDLHRIAVRLNSMNYQLTLLDPEATRNLSRLLWGKNQDIDILTSRLFYFDQLQLQTHIQLFAQADHRERQRMVDWASDPELFGSEGIDPRFIENYTLMRSRLLESSMQNLHRECQRFVAEARPLEVLDQVDSSLEKLRGALLQNFELSDVLLHIGEHVDRRGQITTRYFD